jgi:uracil-DNA glycosylase
MQPTSISSSVTIEDSWKNELATEFNAPYFTELKSFLVAEREKYTVFPPGKLIFAAFDDTPFNKVKVVILGQDPYHGRGQANGLCFSVGPNVPKQPSLVNIFKELKDDLGYPIPEKGGLEPWAKQGVLLLNATLTVREGQPGSHQGKGWERFTDSVIKKISDEKKGIVFLLWGRFAHSKEVLINPDKHFILKAAHPSPLARGAFFGCKHFSKTNKILEQQGIQPIEWLID